MDNGLGVLRFGIVGLAACLVGGLVFAYRGARRRSSPRPLLLGVGVLLVASTAALLWFMVRLVLAFVRG